MFPKFTFNSACETILIGAILCVVMTLFGVFVVQSPLSMAVTEATTDVSVIIVLWGLLKLVVAFAFWVMRPKLPRVQSALPEVTFEEVGTWPPAPNLHAGQSDR